GHQGVAPGGRRTALHDGQRLGRVVAQRFPRPFADEPSPSVRRLPTLGHELAEAAGAAVPRRRLALDLEAETREGVGGPRGGRVVAGARLNPVEWGQSAPVGGRATAVAFASSPLEQLTKHAAILLGPGGDAAPRPTPPRRPRGPHIPPSATRAAGETWL